MNYEINSTKEGIKLGSKTYTLILFLAFISLIFLYLRISDPKLFVVVFGIIFILGIFRTQKLCIKINGIQKCWLIFIVYSMLCTIFADGLFNDLNKKGSVKSSILFLIIYLIVLYFTQFCDRIYFFKLMRNFFALCSILGVIEYITKFQFYQNLITVDAIKRTYLIYGIPGTPNYRLILFFGHPIFFSVFLTIFLILLLYIPFKRKIVNLFFGLIGLICLILTQSRSSWISFFIILVLYILSLNKKHFINIKYLNHFFYTVIILCIFTCSLYYFYPTFFQDLTTNFIDRVSVVISDPQAASGARLANLSLINYVSNFWIMIFGGGNGYALGLLKLHPTVNGWSNAVDNQYLTFLINYGIVGLIIFLYFVIKCIKVLFVSTDKINKMIVLSILSVMFASYFFEFYENMYLNYFIFILIAFIKLNNQSENTIYN